MKRLFQVLPVFLAMFFTVSLFGQFQDRTSTSPVLEDDYTTDMTRTARIGVGFATNNDYDDALGTANRARLAVRDGILAHHVSGEIGTFGDKWCGLGIGNPGGAAGTPKPYGLAIADTGSVGFYNIIREVFEGATRKNTVAEGTNINRFIVRAYSGTNAATGKDLLVANPNGGVGVNAEPQSSLWVDAIGTNLDSLFRAIVIRGSQPLPSSSSTRTVTAIGTQANNSLAGNGIAVEGLRAQIPDFAAVAQTLAGVATNLQTVKNPTGTSALDVITPVLTVTDEYAELTWQDLDFGDEALVDCEDFPIADAEELDKFFISFRNNENTDPFAAGNKLPVMTFQANGRVGIGTLQPTSGSCGLSKQTILLDVNGLIRASGSLVTSDQRFKQDIETIPNSLELIRKMRGATYTFNQEAFPDRNFSGGKQYGFIAQEVAEVIPELAVLNSDGYYALNYTMLIPVLTEAIKEQDATISTLQTELAELRRELSDLKADRVGQNTQGFRLEQNAPNPFSNSTVIRYAIPAGTLGATLSVYDLTGRMLRSFNLNDGEGAVTLNAGDLPDGLYIYDLQVNGRQVLERKMRVARK